MIKTRMMPSPLGEILLAADEEGIIGLWFSGQKYFAAGLSDELCSPLSDEEASDDCFEEVIRWLMLYFSGEKPSFTPKLHLKGTPFQKQVWELLLQIPWGETTTYKELAGKIAAQNHRASMSAQAVGGAVGHNPVSIIVPCHRVIGADGSLTGYAGGIRKKEWMLKMEKTWKKTIN